MGSESTSWEHLVKEAWGRDWQPGLGAGGAETPGRWVIFCFLFFLFNSYLLGYVPWKASYDQPRQHIKKQRHYFANKVCLYSLEGLMLKLKLQYFGHLMERVDSFEKTLMLRKIEGKRRRG